MKKYGLIYTWVQGKGQRKTNQFPKISPNPAANVVCMCAPKEPHTNKLLNRIIILNDIYFVIINNRESISCLFIKFLNFQNKSIELVQ